MATQGIIRSPAHARGTTRWCVVETAWGWCGLQRGSDGISACSLPSHSRSSASLSVADASPEAPHDPLLSTVGRLLVAYFDGEAVCFDAPIAPQGMTEFGLRVLAACARVPWGHTCSYGQLAAAAGAPRAARAVGQALGRNPVPVLVPCHRVIGANGSLIGFGAGLDMKRRLLELEGITDVR